MAEVLLGGTASVIPGEGVDPSSLEMLGKKASSMFLDGGMGLNAAITKLASGSNLGPEHIRRISEFANTATHQSMYSTNPDKTFEFPLADAEVILQEMDQAKTGPKLAGVSIKDTVSAAMSKVADTDFFPGKESVCLEDFFRTEKTAEYPQHNPTKGLEVFVDRIQTVEETLRAKTSGLEMLTDDNKVDLLRQIKQASLYGLTLKDIHDALHKVASNQTILQGLCKEAHDLLADEIHYMTHDQTEKTASGILDTEHPMLQSYLAYEEVSGQWKRFEKASALASKYKARATKMLRDRLRGL